MVKFCVHTYKVSGSWTHLISKVNALCSFKMSRNTNVITQDHSPEDLNPQPSGSINDLEFLD
jgi:hypothetical protein